MSSPDLEKKQRRYAVLTVYDGSAFSGWQRQARATTVQACLEDGWRKLTGERIRLTGGSRTDAGVSARGHVSSFLSTNSIPPEKMALAWNTTLPEAVAVKAVRTVGPAFNPRYDALGKRYIYQLDTGPVRPVLDRGLVAHMPGDLDLLKMEEGAKILQGTHDFTAFMDQGSPSRRPVRTLHRLDLSREGDRITMAFEGDGFLYHMVRILAGTLLWLGRGKLDPASLGDLMERKDRRLLGPTLPGRGLVLDRVYFADQLFGDDAWPWPDSRREEKKAHLRAGDDGRGSVL